MECAERSTGDGHDDPASVHRFVARPVASAVLALALLPLGGCGLLSDPLPVGSLQIALQTNVLAAGDTLVLTAQVWSTDGELLNRRPKWSSNDPDVATMLSAIQLYAEKTGEVWISAELDAYEDSVLVRVAPDELPLFGRPFEDRYSFPLSNPFDHRLPFWTDDPHPEVLDWTGSSLSTLNGHDGYDWPMPTGTPILAVADGVVRFAGREQPWSCPLLDGDTVAARFVRIRHTAPTGERIHSVSLHLDRIDVAEGDSVRMGEPIGLSGNTGCSTGPHLHFEAMREHYWRVPKEGYIKVMDPSGWRGGGLDPWLIDSNGVASTRVWIPGEEPALKVGHKIRDAARHDMVGAMDLQRPGSDIVRLQR